MMLETLLHHILRVTSNRKILVYVVSILRINALMKAPSSLSYMSQSEDQRSPLAFGI